MQTVVVAVQDAELRSTLVSMLRSAGFNVGEQSTAEQSIRAVFDLRPDGVLVDTSLEAEGTDLVAVLRAAADMPIVVLMPSADATLSVQALERGADDVVAYETDTREIVARVRAALRRSSAARATVEDHTIVQTGDIIIDRSAQVVLKRGQEISLSRTEYRLLDALASRLGQVAPHRFLLSTVWGEAFVDDTHYLRVYIGYLRAKLEDVPSEPRYLVNEWGMGYRLMAYPPEDRPTTESGETDRNSTAHGGERVRRRRRRG